MICFPSDTVSPLVSPLPVSKSNQLQLYIIKTFKIFRQSRTLI